jgi:transposase
VVPGALSRHHDSDATVYRILRRDTIHRWIRDGDLDRDLDAAPVRYGPRPPVPTKLAAYKPTLEARLAAYPELSAVRLLEEIRAAGYAGGYTQPKEYVRRVRPTPPPEAVIRFETPAGRQAQVDFARFRLSWGVCQRPVGRARLFAPALVPVLSTPGHGNADRRS